MHRLLKRKNLFALLFAVLLAFPMFSILARTIYVSANKNAKDSYSLYNGTYNIKLTNNYTTSEDELITISSYQVASDKSSFQINLTYATFIDPQIIDLWQITENDTLGIIQLGQDGTNGSRINLQVNNNWVNKNNTWGQTIKSLNFKFRANTSLTINTTNPNYVVFVNKFTQGTLDNAFEYSVNQFIDDNNFGRLDFFQWFNNMFLDSNNSVNNMYVHFVNWYLNYALLISLAYVLFLVLMWFINYVRKLLEKGMDFGEGSY